MAIDRSWKHTPPPPEVIEQKMLAATTAKVRAKPSNTESDIQISCVNWFRVQYPQFAGVFYAVPNGGKRDKKTAFFLNREGVLAGVSDIILDVARNGYHGLRIEMKRPGGEHQKTQKAFEKAVTEQGYLYTLCYSFEEFEKIINNYLK